MDLGGLFSILERIAKGVENQEGNKETAIENFNKALGIETEKQSEKVRELIKSYEDNDEEINACKKALEELEKEAEDLAKTLKNTKDKDKKKETKEKIKENEKKKEYVINKKSDAIVGKAKAELSLTDKGFNIKDVKAAHGKLKQDLNATSKMGAISKGIGKVMKSPYFIAADYAIKAFQFAIDKTTQYLRLETENTLRMISATTRGELNKMKVGLDSWTDAVQGAYSAQELAMDSQIAMIEAQNANTMANLKMAHTWTNWIPILKEYNAYKEAELEQEQKLQEARIKFAKEQLALFNQYSKQTDNYNREQDKAVHQYQVEVGLTAEQTGMFEKRMLGLGESFSKFNKTIADALKMQSQYTETSGRAVNFSNEEYEKNFAVGRLVGEDNLMNFEGQMNIFNQSVSDSADIMYEMYKDANKMGLSQRKLVKDIVSNLKLANKYDFKNGTKGFMELAKWAENARFNLSSLGGALEKVQAGGIEGIIKQSAGLQVLGGQFAMGSDPLGMMFESFAAPEDYAKRIQKMFSTMGTFNKETGETSFNIQEQIMMRAASEHLGISLEEAKNMARGSRQKEFVKRQMGGTGLSEEAQDAIANKAQYNKETGEWYVNMLNGQTKSVSQLSETDLDNIRSGNQEEDAIKYAQSTLSVTEQIEATTKQINAQLGLLTFDKFAEMSKEEMKTTLDVFSKYQSNFEKAYAQNKEDALEAQKEALEKSFSKVNENLKMQEVIKKTEGKRFSEDDDENAYLNFTNGVKTDEVINYLKKNPKARQKLNEKEINEIYNEDRRQWYQKSTLGGYNNAQIWVKGKNDTDYVKSEMSKRHDKYLGGSHGIIGKVATPIYNWIYPDNYKSKEQISTQDAIASGSGNSMMVEAQNVTPIEDGSVKLAKTDPRDSAIFAKTGGPFDKLFDGILGKVSETYSYINSNQRTNSQITEMILNNSYETKNGFESVIEHINQNAGGIKFLTKNISSGNSVFDGSDILNTLTEIRDNIRALNSNGKETKSFSEKSISEKIQSIIQSPLSSMKYIFGGNRASTSNVADNSVSVNTISNLYRGGNTTNNTTNGSILSEYVKFVNNISKLKQVFHGNRNETNVLEGNISSNSNIIGGNTSITDNRRIANDAINTLYESFVNPERYNDRVGTVKSRMGRYNPVTGEKEYNITEQRLLNTLENHYNNVTGGVSNVRNNYVGGSTTLSDNRGISGFISNVDNRYVSNNNRGRNVVNNNGINNWSVVRNGYIGYNSRISDNIRYGNSFKNIIDNSKAIGSNVSSVNNSYGGDVLSNLYESFVNPDAYNNRMGTVSRGIGRHNPVTGEKEYNFTEQMLLHSLRQQYNNNIYDNVSNFRDDYKNISTILSDNRRYGSNVNNSLNNDNVSLTDNRKYGSKFRNIVSNLFSSIIGGNSVTNNSYSGDVLSNLYESFFNPEAHSKRVEVIKRGMGRYNPVTGEKEYNITEQSLLNRLENHYNNVTGGISNVRNFAKGGNSVINNSYGGINNELTNKLLTKNNIFGDIVNNRGKNTTVSTNSSIYSDISNVSGSYEVNPLSIFGENGKKSVISRGYESGKVKPQENRGYNTPILDNYTTNSYDRPTDTNVKLSDLNLNINGNIKLEGKDGQSVDISSMVTNNPMFVRKITELIVTQMNNNDYGGRNELFHKRFTR